MREKCEKNFFFAHHHLTSLIDFAMEKIYNFLGWAMCTEIGCKELSDDSMKKCETERIKIYDFVGQEVCVLHNKYEFSCQSCRVLSHSLTLYTLILQMNIFLALIKYINKNL
jgi:hypothetical protein